MRRPSRGMLWAGAGLLALLGLVLATAPWWTRVLSRPAPDEEGEEAAPAAVAEDEPALDDAQGQITVKLFFHASDRDGLLMEERAVPYFADVAQQARAVLDALVAGPRSGLLPTLAPDTRVLEVFVSPRAVAYVSLSPEAVQSAARGGSDAELMAVYSVVNTLTTNFPAIRRVQILIDDRPVSTLSGHVDLMRPLGPDLQWLATNIAPSPSPAPDGP